MKIGSQIPMSATDASDDDHRCTLQAGELAEHSARFARGLDAELRVQMRTEIACSRQELEEIARDSESADLPSQPSAQP